ncbi:MAG: quinoprotein dehydrogenase-associated SoxYZ-like carrier [Gammaproteobacteria bacterium]|nr:quinoprotein dehydrogenase-associated SoxYZ-like carrier [Gammaproteobacteria bacterium]
MSQPFRIAVILLALLGALPAAAQQSAVDVWETLLRPHHFPDTEIIEDSTVIELSTPYRSEDAAFTPLRITAKIPQTPARYIESIHLFVDHNPEPEVGTFHFTPAAGRADLALRIRIDRYTDVRAIAVLNNGEHHMVKSFVKAQGGCAIPVAIDYKQAMAGLGKIQLHTLTDKVEDGAGLPTQLRIRHPNFTGMQMDYKIYAVRPAHYVNSIRVLLNGEAIMTAETGISISEDPSFRFFVNPDAKGTLTAEITDTKGNSWEESLTL